MLGNRFSLFPSNLFRKRRRIDRRWGVDLVGCCALLLCLLLCGATRVTRAAEATEPQQQQAAVTKQAEAFRAEQYAIASELVSRYPTNFDAWRIMGFVHSSHGNLGKMAACWQKCRELRPDRAEIYDQLGRYAFQTEAYEEAIDYWQTALELDPDMPGVHQQVGHAFLNLGQAHQASQALRRELKISPKSSQSYYLLGEAFFQMRDYDRAKQAYLAATKLAPAHRHAYYGLIKASTRLGQTQAAASFAQQFQRLEDAADRADLEYRRRFDDLQQMREKLAITCVDAGRIYLRENNIEAAERLLVRASAVDTKNVLCRSLLAELYAKRRQLPQAIEQYQELIRLEPGEIGHQQQVGMLYARTGNMKSAETAFRQMVQLAPDNAAGYRLLAKLYLNTNQQAALALKLARKAAQLDPVADSFFVLGWSNAKSGNLQDAHTALSEALRLAPDNATYRQLHELVQQSIQQRKGN